MASLLVPVAILLLSLASIFPIASVKASSTTYVNVINPDTGNDDFIFPPETPIGTTFLANVTVTNVEMLAAWQLRLTWDPALLKIASSADIFLPVGHVFEGLDPDPVGLEIHNDVGYVFWIVGIGLGAPVDHYDGSGVMCQIRFTILKNLPVPLSCDLVLDRVTVGWYTTLVDPDANDIPFTEGNGNYVIIPEFPTTALLLTFLIITSVAAVLTKKTWSVKHRKLSVAS